MLLDGVGVDVLDGVVRVVHHHALHGVGGLWRRWRRCRRWYSKWRGEKVEEVE